MKNSIFLSIIFSSLLWLLTISCAQTGTISGGEKDTEPPYMKKSKPGIYVNNFDGKKCKIKFDEYFTLDNVDSKFLLSPPYQEQKPKIKTKGKKIIVKFKEALKEDTTYTLQFFNSIKDFNEGNVLDDFDFVFSTGEVVDSMQVSGFIKDANTMQKEEGMIVGLYDSNLYNDSTPKKCKPNYITRTDTAGHFVFKNIKEGSYRIFAIKDINENQIFDLENEKIAYMRSTITPKCEKIFQVDSLFAGTVLRSGSKLKPIYDTILKDTAIVHDMLYCTPNNINLYAFEEVKIVQYITERKRELRQQALISFNKAVDDSIFITYVEDTTIVPNIYQEFNHNRDSLNLWLVDTTDCKNDTLKLRVSFWTLDSLNNPILETDTLPFRYAVKKVNPKDKKASVKVSDVDSLFFRLKTNVAGEIDLNQKINLMLPLPTQIVNKEEIQLFELVDTSFNEDMSQKMLKAERLDSAKFRFVFKRPVKGNVIFFPTDYRTDSLWCNYFYYPNRDTVDVIVNDSAYYHKTFKAMIKHRNDYYLGQEQRFRDSVKTNIVSQKIQYYNRENRDTIKMRLEKAPSREILLDPINFDVASKDNWAEIITNDDRITIVLKDENAKNKDTLAFKFTTFDMMAKNKKGDKEIEKFYKDTIFAKYAIKDQKLKKSERFADDSIIFVFSRALLDNPTISIYDNNISNFYDLQLNDTKDTAIIAIKFPMIANIDSLKINLKYLSQDRMDSIFEKNDSLCLVKPIKKDDADKNANNKRRKSSLTQKSEKGKQEAEEGKFKAQLLMPIEYTMEDDTLNSRNHIISFDILPEKQYMLRIEDSTFNSIFDTPNKYYEGRFKSKSLDSYGKLIVNVQNCGNIDYYEDIDKNLPPFEMPDTSTVPSLKIDLDNEPITHPTIENGYLIICLCNEKGDKVIRSKEITEDGQVVFDCLAPGNYTLLAIRDNNANKKWDTGDYLKDIYPERTIKFRYKQIVKSKWTSQTRWKF